MIFVNAEVDDEEDEADNDDDDSNKDMTEPTTKKSKMENTWKNQYQLARARVYKYCLRMLEALRTSANQNAVAKVTDQPGKFKSPAAPSR